MTRKITITLEENSAKDGFYLTRTNQHSTLNMHFDEKEELGMFNMFKTILQEITEWKDE